MLNDLFIALLGMVIVFAVLILLWYIIEAIKLVAKENNKDKAETMISVGMERSTVDIQDEDEIAPEEEKELVAVLAAAIAASLDVSVYDLNIKSIKRVPSYAPVWNRVGRQQQVMNRV